MNRFSLVLFLFINLSFIACDGGSGGSAGMSDVEAVAADKAALEIGYNGTDTNTMVTTH